MGEYYDKRVVRLDYAYENLAQRKPPKRIDFEERARMFGMSDEEFEVWACDKKWGEV